MYTLSNLAYLSFFFFLKIFMKFQHFAAFLIDFGKRLGMQHLDAGQNTQQTTCIQNLVAKTSPVGMGGV